jgi:hypothetical protein
MHLPARPLNYRGTCECGMSLFSVPPLVDMWRLHLPLLAPLPYQNAHTRYKHLSHDTLTPPLFVFPGLSLGPGYLDSIPPLLYSAGP